MRKSISARAHVCVLPCMHARTHARSVADFLELAYMVMAYTDFLELAYMVMAYTDFLELAYIVMAYRFPGAGRDAVRGGAVRKADGRARREPVGHNYIGP